MNSPLDDFRRLHLPARVGFLAICLLATSSIAGPLEVETSSVPSAWIVRHEGRNVLQYAYAPGRFKPYVKELATLDGRNLLRDAPSDHLHHHALMYAVRVEGINFWEEVPGSGIQRPVETTIPAPTTPGPGRSRASLHQTLHWLKPEHAFLPATEGHALLVERRSLTLEVDEPGHEVSLLWRSEFETVSGHPEVVVDGANCFGLGARFLAEMDSSAVHFAADGPLDVANGRQDVSQHPWAAVAFDRPGSGSTFAILGHPRNPGGAPWFFSMKTPFAYLSATERPDRQPRVLARGDRVALEFLVLALPGRATPDALEARYRRWIAPAP